MESKIVAEIPADVLESLDSFHAKYVARFAQPGEFTVQDWADRYWNGNKEFARDELDLLFKQKTITKRPGADSTGRSCSIYRLVKTKNPPSE